MFENLDSITFTKLTKHNSDVKMIFSPKGHAAAYAVQNELVIENLESEESQTRFICDYTIDFILWSPDSELICCGMFKHNLIRVWSTVDPSWRCKISEGLFEITGITWTPDSRHLLVICESNFKITIWSLVSTGFTIIENPKLMKNCFSFSNCSNYLAVVERKDFVDCIGIYSCNGWQLLKHFPVDMEHVGEIQFSSSELIIAVLPAVSEEYKVLFYSIEGRLLSTYLKDDTVLGITSLTWSPKNNVIVLGDYFEKITLLSRRRYKEIYSLNLPESISSKEANVYRIAENPTNIANAGNNSFSLYEVVDDRPFSILPSGDVKKVKHKSSKSGIHMLQFSIDGHYVAIVGSSMPNVVFIFNTKTFSFSDVIVQSLKIRSIAWHPEKSILAFSSGCTFVDLWTPVYCIRLISPYENEFLIKNAEWSARKESLILNGKDFSAIVNLPVELRIE